MSNNFSTFSPEFSDVIRSIIDTVLLDVMVCLPGKIVKYNAQTQYADVQIQLLSKYMDGSLKSYPVIPNVPVKHPRANGGKAFIHMPLKPGDDVTLHFSQRSIDNWKTQGGMSDPADPRKHHITDAFASIGGSAIPDAFTPTTDDGIEIVNGDTQMIVKPDGTFEVTNTTAEFVDTLNQITTEVQSVVDKLSVDTVNTIFGPQRLNAFAFYFIEAQKLQLLLNKLESFKV